ncbi:hypothetical protein BCU68_16405 [Vibrio sp. 10N.286.49.B3]|nr:hypothetical protein BCU68_16405 [Vibrio sp. 10N.286.49.B3]
MYNNAAKCMFSDRFVEKGSIRFKMIRKTLYSLVEFAMIRSALERCVGKTSFELTFNEVR